MDLSFWDGVLTVVAVVAAVILWLLLRTPAPPRKPPQRVIMCDECREQIAVVWCEGHALHLCVGCLYSHDIPIECSYRPLTMQYVRAVREGR